MSKRAITLVSAVLVTFSLVAISGRPGAADDSAPGDSAPDDSAPDDSAEAKVPAYAGVKSCKMCHFQQHKSWAKTAMSKAFESLKPDQAVDAKKAAGLDPKKDYTTDAKCLQCHTTAYGHASGYPAVTEGKTFTDAQKAQATLNEGVTCEACHGPGSLYGPYKLANKDYKRAEIQKLGAIAPVTKANCAHCHRKECPTMPKDYKFSFDDFKGSDKIHKHKPLKREH